MKQKNRLAIVLGGGGGRGAYQVGALRALIEEGIQPDLLVGTSIGAVNGAFLALNGITTAAIDQLEQAWMKMRGSKLLFPDFRWVMMGLLFGHLRRFHTHEMKAIFQAYGFQPELTFGDLQTLPLYVVATDLNSSQMVLYGTHPQEGVMEAMLASCALPPLIPPLHLGKKFLIDGGAVSNLPIEPAVNLQATEIIALDISDPTSDVHSRYGWRDILGLYLVTIEQRLIDLETRLARRRGVTVHRLRLAGSMPGDEQAKDPISGRMRQGYQAARKFLAKFHQKQPVKKDPSQPILIHQPSWDKNDPAILK